MNFNHKLDFEKYIQESFKSIGAAEYNVLFLHVDLRAWGLYSTLFDSKDDFIQAFVGPLLDKGITLVIPTFTYTASGEFYVDKTQTYLGAMNKWFLKQSNVVRSHHPMFSFAAIGPEAYKLKQVGKSAFGAKSIYDFFEPGNGAYLHIGIPVEMGNTFIHRVEFLCGASYRYQKVFPTKVFMGIEYIGTDYSACVRKLDYKEDDFKASFFKLKDELFEKKLVREFGDSNRLFNLSLYPIKETTDYLIDRFYEDPTIFIKSNYRNYE